MKSPLEMHKGQEKAGVRGLGMQRGLPKGRGCACSPPKYLQVKLFLWELDSLGLGREDVGSWGVTVGTGMSPRWLFGEGSAGKALGKQGRTQPEPR